MRLQPKKRRAVHGAAIGRRAIVVYECQGCGISYPNKINQCPACGRLDFLRFDSKGEQARWANLKLLERAGEISNLRRQVRYPLLAHSSNGKPPAIVAHYVADFVYTENECEIIEDFKGSVLSEIAEFKIRFMEAMGFNVTIVRTP